jgi:molybdopterin converting factor small subunit
MNTIRLEILPWLSGSLSENGATRAVLQWDIASGTTVRDVLDQLAAQHPPFARILYDDRGQVATHISVIVNNRLYELAGGLEAELRAGDVVCLLPAFSGG